VHKDHHNLAQDTDKIRKHDSSFFILFRPNSISLAKVVSSLGYRNIITSTYKSKHTEVKT